MLRCKVIAFPCWALGVTVVAKSRKQETLVFQGERWGGVLSPPEGGGEDCASGPVRNWDRSNSQPNPTHEADTGGVRADAKNSQASGRREALWVAMVDP